ncbi:uncharacterized protein LOC106508546 isoform X2 [Sus scrofa]|nr:uncharacterized protein LOC106508546 isoform X2 [Sus scrofa]XP_020927070.1 uncharacterized protein LOC106508546 isoform X2 [Sus scrofa]XP_020927071.1 uncharacterized protein LOC106508546 isoform X2 [Sus scrofa]XP_020927072.1 uncharacterized protein LOC106508546 isoform X2 [Sus scrofa]XP_020927073.1 uncharacterized protein LOC106508546 isoform X2 [Sus scrofa]XP_020927074.1 uncharacterized protein LOC106508546 isoform X2 [Sus scrofa]XP_020927075.1 uncharacterized protein LOC106508546 isoform
MDLRTPSGLGAKCWYFTAATASQTGCGKQEGDSLRVPLLWRHSWAEQDLLQTTTRETESIWFNRCPGRQAPEELAANPAMLEASSAAQPISDITDLLEYYWDNCPNEVPSTLYKCLQMHGWWCGSDGARVTSRLFSGPCKQSRPMTCSIMPFEEEASSVMMKKNQGVPPLTIGSSSRLQRGKQGRKKTASASMVTGQL